MASSEDSGISQPLTEVPSHPMTAIPRMIIPTPSKDSLSDTSSRIIPAESMRPNPTNPTTAPPIFHDISSAKRAIKPPPAKTINPAMVKPNV